MARSQATQKSDNKYDSNGFLQIIDRSLRNMIGEVITLLRVNNRHLEEMSGNTLNEDDLEGSQFSKE